MSSPRIKREMAAAQLERETALQELAAGEQEGLFHEMAQRIENMVRAYFGRRRAAAARVQLFEAAERGRAALVIQKKMRGVLGRAYVRRVMELMARAAALGEAATAIERVQRGFAGRRIVAARRRDRAARFVARVGRGFLGRCRARRERARFEWLRRRSEAATSIQATWRMKVMREEFQLLRVHTVAGVEIQRCYRGHLGRKRSARRRDWESAEPGPERLRLGLRLIEESKVAFERQQEEIDALHRAQARAESRVSHVHAELRESEKELTVLERELQEIDQIERDLRELTHEREMLQLGITNAAGLEHATGSSPDDGAEPPDILTLVPRGMMITTGGDDDVVLDQFADPTATTMTRGHHGPRGGGGSSSSAGLADSAAARRLRADSHALEIAIHRKRAERERKRQELEAEFASVFAEVERKKHALERLELAIADMEATRVRKDREFSRLQRNLMELLQEQKYELDSLREKGIELETATATSAAAATATALRAKEHEKRSATVFSQTEELMKFQFMSMSLSYFSSLNMLQQLREMNADTTTAAVAASADAAAAAAAAATAANIPTMKHMRLGSEDVLTAALKKKHLDLDAARRQEDEAKRSKLEPFPPEVRLWSVADVLRWLETLSLGQYKAAFREASVDGEFLLELREEDLVQVLGMDHKLHVRKVLLGRDKLRPLTDADVIKKTIALREEAAAASVDLANLPTVEMVFSQARNSRTKRLEESLNAGFPVDTQDDKGNTLLCLAAQNLNQKLCELLLGRNADLNHQNALGNTPLHFAMAYDADGTLAEYLIQRGADDTIENKVGCTCYDGIGAT